MNDKEGTQIELTVVGVSGVWSLGAALLLWATVEEGFEKTLHHWALFLVAAAATWTILIGMTWSRRRTMRAVRYELQLLRDNEEERRHVAGRFEIV